MVFIWLLGLAMAMESFDWIVLNDTVMGGRSSATVSDVDDTVQFQGIVSLENNGGFASIRTRDAIDLSTHTTVELELIGTDVPVQFVIWTGQGANCIMLLLFSQIPVCNVWIFLSLLRNPMVVRCRLPSLDVRNRQNMSIGVLIGDGFEGAFDLTLNELQFDRAWRHQKGHLIWTLRLHFE